MDPLELLLKALVIAAGAAAALMANPVVRLLLRRIDPPEPQTSGTRLLDTERVMPGGRWIGLLERAAVYATIVAGFPAGIAMIIAIKGLGRYPQLRAQAETRVGELFIIGTFASMLWAAAFAGIVYGVVRLW